MKILGIIPARYASSRFPGKPLIDIAGKSMIQRVYEQASKCVEIDTVIVATDDERIFKHVKNFGGHVLMTNVNHLNGTSRCGEVIEVYSDYDVVVNIQGDEPLINPDQLASLTKAFENPQVEIATLIKKIEDYEDIFNPNRIKVVTNESGKALYFSRSPIPHVQNTSHDEWLKKSNFYKHIGIYAWRTNTLSQLLKLKPHPIELAESLEQLRWLCNGFQIYTVETAIETPNIDTPEDLQKVLKQLGH